MDDNALLALRKNPDLLQIERTVLNEVLRERHTIDTESNTRSPTSQEPRANSYRASRSEKIDVWWVGLAAGAFGAFAYIYLLEDAFNVDSLSISTATPVEAFGDILLKLISIVSFILGPLVLLLLPFFLVQKDFDAKRLVLSGAHRAIYYMAYFVILIAGGYAGHVVFVNFSS
jgi:VIT1/CCC1 family predicted Fe2+/Mn2+ transporter